MKTKHFICILLIAFLMQSCVPKRSGVAVRFSEEATYIQIDTVDIGAYSKQNDDKSNITQKTTSNKSIHKDDVFIRDSYELIDEIFIGVPLNMTICKNELFIGDFHEPMIIHYNLKDRKTNRFLSKGRGPGETQPPVQLYANSSGDNKLYRYSNRVYEMGFYSLDSLSIYVPLFTLPFGYFDVIPFEKDRYLSVGLFEDEYRYRVLDAEGKVIGSFGDYPDFFEGENLIPFDSRAMFHQVTFVNSYPKKKIVAAGKYIVDIMDYSFDIKNISIKRFLLASYEYEYGSGLNLWAQAKRGIVRGASSVACDDTYIYLLFDPGMVREEKKGIKKEIWVFDWNGQPVKKLILDADVMIITADPYSDDHTVYGLAYKSEGENEYYKIIKIKL